MRRNESPWGRSGNSLILHPSFSCVDRINRLSRFYTPEVVQNETEMSGTSVYKVNSSLSGCDVSMMILRFLFSSSKRALFIVKDELFIFILIIHFRGWRFTFQEPLSVIAVKYVLGCLNKVSLVVAIRVPPTAKTILRFLCIFLHLGTSLLPFVLHISQFVQALSHRPGVSFIFVDILSWQNFIL